MPRLEPFDVETAAYWQGYVWRDAKHDARDARAPCARSRCVFAVFCHSLRAIMRVGYDFAEIIGAKGRDRTPCAPRRAAECPPYQAMCWLSVRTGLRGTHCKC